MSEVFNSRIAEHMEEVGVKFKVMAHRFEKQGKLTLALNAQKRADYWFDLAEKARGKVVTKPNE